MAITKEFEDQVSAAVDEGVSDNVVDEKGADNGEEKEGKDNSQQDDFSQESAAHVENQDNERDSDSAIEEKDNVDVEDEETSDVSVIENEKDTVVEADVSGSDKETVKSPSNVDNVPSISDGALTRAVVSGLSLSDARKFPSEESLLNFVATIEDVKRSYEHKEEKEEVEEDPLADLPEIDPEKYEPEVAEILKGFTSVIKKQQDSLKEFKEHQERVMLSNQESSAREVESWFDKQIESLGDDFAESLGTGPYRSLDQGSSQFAKRDQIAGQLAILLSGYAASGQHAPPREEVFDAAARLVLRDEFETVNQKKLADKLAGRSSQHIQRPGGGKAKTKLSPEDEVAAKIDEKFFG